MSLIKQIYSYKQEIDTLWYEDNCLNEENLEYIKNVLLKPFRMVNSVKEEQDAYGETALIIQYQMATYKIEIDKEHSCLILWKKKQTINSSLKKYNPKDKELYTLIDRAGNDGCFKGVDAWVDIINWIARWEIKNGINI